MTVTIIAASKIRDKLSAFAPSVEGSSLYLLRAIDQTVDSLQVDEKFASAIAAEALLLVEEIRSTPEVPAGRFLDPEDKVISKLEGSYRALEEYLPRLLLKKSTINEDGRLDGEQSELLHIAYDRCIEALASLIEAIKDLRAAVISHDLTAELPPSETFASPEALVAALHTDSA